MYCGYYCKKCKIIPLIKPSITKNKELKFLLKCKCKITFLSLDQINKYYYSKNIDPNSIINEILMGDIKNDDSLLIKFNEYLSRIKNNNKYFFEVKNNFINFLQSKIE